MTTIYKVWLSTDAKYYAVQVPDDPLSATYDVLAVNGPGVWLARRYTGANRHDLRYAHTECAGVIASWTNRGR